MEVHTDRRPKTEFREASPDLTRQLKDLFAAPAEPRWSAGFFLVDQSPLFQNLEPALQQQFLIENSRQVVNEILAIEHAGVAAAHKLTEAAQTAEQRAFFTAVACGKLEHLRWLAPWAPQ